MLGSLIPTCSNCGRVLPEDGSPCPSCALPSPAATAPAGDAPEGLVAGRYLLQRRLGRGAAKDVWLAHDLTLDRAVALARVSGPAAWERLRREARLTARLGGHRHIVTVHDVFDDEGTPCLVARYMTGGSLADRLSRASGGRLEPAEAIRAGREIALALAHAHMHGIVHRDVKPDNVWLDGDGEAALGDFGIALADGETTGGSHGTPLYAAPEQARGEEVTARSDLYALGATLFELLHGRPPREASALEGVPEPLERLVRALLAERPEDRPGAAADVAATLERMIAPGPAPTEAPPGLVGRSAELVRLRAALDDAWAGATRTVAVVGEPGIGKSTLLDALAAEAQRRGGRVLRGRAQPVVRAYGVWREIVRSLAPAGKPPPPTPLQALIGAPPSDAAPGGEEERLRLFDAVADLLATAAAERPLLIVLDDLHWADASSLALLGHVAGAERGARVLVAAAYRADEAPRLDALERDPRFERIDLTGLGADDLRALVPSGASVGDASLQAIHARTAGNPFYVAELVRALAADGRLGEDGGSLPPLVPTRVREFVRRRVERLGPDVGPVLEVAAVAGRFTIADLVRAAGATRPVVAAALERSTGAGLVVSAAGAPGHFAFAHAIVRDAVNEALTERRRGELHEAVGAALRARRDAGADVAAAQLAHHALAAARDGADPQPAWQAALDAAREASVMLGAAEAARHYAG